MRHTTDVQLSTIENKHRAEYINWQTSLDKQVRISDRFKQELKMTAEAYEKVISGLKEELAMSQQENVHWRVEIKKAAWVRSQRMAACKEGE